ncbi:hypothetical protein [Salinifilum ghardaiensis]
MTQPSGQAQQAAAAGTAAISPVARRPRALYALLALFAVDMALNTAAVAISVPGEYWDTVLLIGAGVIAVARLAAFTGLWRGNGSARELLVVGQTFLAGALALVAFIFYSGFLHSGSAFVLGLRSAAVVCMLLGSLLAVSGVVREWCSHGRFRVIRRPGQGAPATEEDPDGGTGLGEWTGVVGWGWAADVPIVRIGGFDSEPFVEAKARRCRTLVWGTYQGFPAMVAQMRFIKRVPSGTAGPDMQTVHEAKYYDVVCAVLETDTALPELTVRQRKDATGVVADVLKGDNARAALQRSNVSLPEHRVGSLFSARSSSEEFARQLVTPELMEAVAPAPGMDVFRFNFRFTGTKVVVWSMMTADMRPESIKQQLGRAHDLYRRAAPLARTAPASKPAFAPLQELTEQLR